MDELTEGATSATDDPNTHTASRATDTAGATSGEGEQASATGGDLDEGATTYNPPAQITDGAGSDADRSDPAAALGVSQSPADDAETGAVLQRLADDRNATTDPIEPTIDPPLVTDLDPSSPSSADVSRPIADGTEPHLSPDLQRATATGAELVNPSPVDLDAAPRPWGDHPEPMVWLHEQLEAFKTEVRASIVRIHKTFG
jgi:hypothetical protein